MVWISLKNAIVERKIQTLTLGDKTLILNVKSYWLEAITTILRPYEFKSFSEQLNKIKVDDDAITSPMEKFAGTIPDITHYNHPTWGCPVIVLESILQGNISGLPN